MRIQHSAAPLGAEITGLDLAQPVDSKTFQQIEDLLHDRGVIVFRGQDLTEEQHITFSRRFGDLEIHVATQCLRPGYPEILVVSNVIEDGKPIGLADAGQYWHSDLSYVRNPSRGSLLLAREVPVQDGRVLGETLFASAAYAYDTLPEGLKARLSTLTAVHGYGYRYELQNSAGLRGKLSDQQLSTVPDVHHPVIRRHPITGRKVLFVNEGFTHAMAGMDQAEGQALLQQLFDHITRPEALYRHNWQVGDLLMWDNCLVQHRAIRNYEWPMRRLMHRTTVAGVESFQ
ncbi:MAG: TauD/TfdA family dioxygenase [Bryobacterales bacterium]|nr:TauD/TfdA family dioxygenase [Bryobacterales bacterium]